MHKGLTDALLLDRQIDVVYAPGPQGTPRSYRLHPLGLILRGGTTYLVASKGGAATSGLFALHRFRQVDVRPEAVSHPPGFDLEAALKRGRGQFGIGLDGAAPLRLAIACNRELADLVQESRLSADQEAKPRDDGRIEIRATVVDSWELRWWLLSQGKSVEVLAPAALRRDVARTLCEAADQYGSST